MLQADISSWTEYKAVVAGERYRTWAFRGHADSTWRLESALARYLKTYGVHPDAWPWQEERIIRVFKRKGHLHLAQVPPEDDDFQWLALMQHHGAPTRLLDFTWSPYVAAFFALERAVGPAAVWALHVPSLYSRTTVHGVGGSGDLDDISPRTTGNFRRYFLPGTLAKVYVGEPHVMNKRLTAQSGTFVVSGTLSLTIDEVLAADPKLTDSICKFELKPGIRRDAMRDLFSMNVTNATLFPDLDGLARSLAYELEFHWERDPSTNRPIPGFDDPLA